MDTTVWVFKRTVESIVTGQPSGGSLASNGVLWSLVIRIQFVICRFRDAMNTVRTLKRVRAAVPVKTLVQFHNVGFVEEYLRFLVLKLLCDDFDTLPPALSPSHAVDAVWHTHMLLPHAYARTCRVLLPGQDAVFKHSPVPRSDPIRYARTLKMYKNVFGITPNPAAWPDEAQSPAPSSEIQIFVKTLARKSFSVHIPPEATIEHLKAKLQEAWDFSVNQQRLFYAGRQLEDGRTLCDYSIGPQSTLRVVLRLSGC